MVLVGFLGSKALLYILMAGIMQVFPGFLGRKRQLLTT